MTSIATLLDIPETRRNDLLAIAQRLEGVRRVVLCSHINSDADAIGSEAGVAAWLEARGARVTIINPSPIPSSLRFLLHREELDVDHDDPRAEERIAEADVILVLDTGEPKRIHPLEQAFPPEKTYVVDHHLPGAATVGQGGVQDTSAAATGELVYDLIELTGGEWNEASVLAVYVAIVSDTGSFRFGNTSPRAHAIAAHLLSKGIDPEDVFRLLFAVAPLRRLELLREALDRLGYDADLGIAWMVLPLDVTERLGATSDDFDGLIDHARSLEGTKVAIMVRETAPNESKISLRSSGQTDVNRIARHFGGGGHVKASGATLKMGGDEAIEAVLEVVRGELQGDSGSR